MIKILHQPQLEMQENKNEESKHPQMRNSRQSDRPSLRVQFARVSLLDGDCQAGLFCQGGCLVSGFPGEFRFCLLYTSVFDYAWLIDSS